VVEHVDDSVDRLARLLLGGRQPFLHTVELPERGCQSANNVLVQSGGQFAPIVLLHSDEAAGQPLTIRRGPPQRGHVMEQHRKRGEPAVGVARLEGLR